MISLWFVHDIVAYEKITVHGANAFNFMKLCKQWCQHKKYVKAQIIKCMSKKRETRNTKRFQNAPKLHPKNKT